jgi:AP-3 complex subunit delta
VIFHSPNLVKYVALLAFNKIVVSHPQLVASHQDVILACIDDPDISIRLQALQLGSGMITADNLQIVVDRLMKQLREARRPEDNGIEPFQVKPVEPSADWEGEDPEEALKRDVRQTREAQTLPTEYRAATIRQILDMCSRNTYTNILDFDWYIDTLVDLVRVLPSPSSDSTTSSLNDVAAAVGAELRTVAVRVVSARPYAVQAANQLLLNRETLAAIPGSGLGSLEVLEYAAWIVGEYTDVLADPLRALDALLLLPKDTSGYKTICAYLQAIPKSLATIFASKRHGWNDQVQAQTSLILARTVQFMDRFVDHPSLEVQERAVGFLELTRLSQEAVTNHDRESTTSPLIISEALPSLFNGQELNPVAASAQKKVPLPDGMDLNTPINVSLAQLLLEADNDALAEAEVNPTKVYYYQKPESVAIMARPAIESITDVQAPTSYQNAADYGTDATTRFLQKAERRERNRDDPFYIPSNETSGRNTPLNEVLRSTNGQEIEIDSIPIMELNTGDIPALPKIPSHKPTKSRRQVQVMAEETFDGEPTGTISHPRGKLSNENIGSKGSKRSLLQVDSSTIGSLSLTEDHQNNSDLTPSEDQEMAKALAEVERMRMEMQRASERVSLAEDAAGGTMVKKKKKKKKAAVDEGDAAPSEEQVVDEVVVKRKKKKKPKEVPSTSEL